MDSLLVPAANIFLESRKEEMSAKWLLSGIGLCDEKEELIPFARKKMELYTYLLDVYQLTGQEEKYLETVDVIKTMNEKYKEFGIYVDVNE